MTKNKSSYYYEAHSKQCASDDFWGQVKRTVNGKPVSQEQIDMIVKSVISGLDLSRDDGLLDLCCGNGALTDYFFSRCKRGLGVDSSAYLVDVAKANFMCSDDHGYIMDDVINFVENYPHSGKFSKILCYGAIMYLTPDKVAELLALIRGRFDSVVRFYIGNIPDKGKVREFFGENYIPGIENNPEAPVGVWWSRDDFRDTCTKAGWSTELLIMPDAFYASNYRFDCVLLPD